MIQEKAMICTLNISVWTARKFDGKATKEVEQLHNSNNAGRFNKLLASKDFTERIQKTASAARLFHYKNTLSWGNEGIRLLPNENYFEYLQGIKKFKSDFDPAVDELIDTQYDDMIADAKLRLNGLFNPADFPGKEELRLKFNFEVNFEPVAGSNFFLDLNKEEEDKIRKSYEKQLALRIDDAIAEIVSRVKNVVQNIREKMMDKDAIFRDSLFGNLKEVIAIIPRLNVTNDNRINSIISDLSGLVSDPSAIRDNDNLRSQKAEEAQTILNKISSFFKN